MIPKIREPGRPVTPADIAMLEKRLSCTLPAPYASFLQRNNGGRPKPRAFSGQREEDEALLQHFFAIDGTEHTDVIENAALFREYHDVPKSLLPIGRTTSGDVVCIGIEATNCGKIFFWSHDAPVREKSTWLLAHDLDSFLATFHDIDLSEP